MRDRFRVLVLKLLLVIFEKCLMINKVTKDIHEDKLINEVNTYISEVERFINEQP